VTADAAEVTVRLNGSPRAVPAGTDVAALVRELAATAVGTAVAVNGEVVPRRAWAGTPVRDGDEIEVLAAVQGG
jgi:sulfur carrier protein